MLLSSRMFLLLAFLHCNFRYFFSIYSVNYNFVLGWQLDFAVIKYRNQKLSEQLAVHKFEYHALEGKFDDLKQKQKSHHETQDLVNKSWQHVS